METSDSGEPVRSRVGSEVSVEETASLVERGRLNCGLRGLAHGIVICGLVALAARFLSDHYGVPAMLMALLLGMTIRPVASESRRAAPGIDFASKRILRIGVALLGARISFEVFNELGWGVVVLVVCALIATLFFGYFGARALGRGWRLAILTSGAVAICGASAAMAISAILPRNEFSERNLGFTVFGVTLLSTVAMVVYPIITQSLGMDPLASGVFLGGTIHDVAQVVGAGFSISDSVGETATTVKLIRVSMLAPFVLILTLVLRILRIQQHSDANKPPIIPGFVAVFVVLAICNSFGLIPGWLQALFWDIARWAMLAAIAAVGLKTDLKRILDIPPQSVVLIVGETMFIAVFVILGLRLVL